MAILRSLLAKPVPRRLAVRCHQARFKGDIHDIGQNLVTMMMEGAGFEVFDLGINKAAEATSKPSSARCRHLGTSVLLRRGDALSMKVVIDTLKEKASVRRHHHAGGRQPISTTFAKARADAWPTPPSPWTR